MLLVEFDRIEMEFYRNGILQWIRFVFFESNQLYANTFQVVQLFFAEFFQEDLCIRLHNALVAADPAIVLAIHIVEKQIVIAVIDNIFSGI